MSKAIGPDRRSVIAGAIAALASPGIARAAANPKNWKGRLKINERSTPIKIEYWKQLGARFVERAPQLQFVVEPSDVGTNYDTKLLTASLSKTGGDLAWLVTTQNFNLFQSKNLLQPVDKLIKDDRHDMSPYMAKALEAVTVKGQLYMIPTGVHGGPVSMFYNKKLFDEAGLAYPNPNWSIGDMEAAAQKLTRKDRDQYGLMIPFDNPEALVVLSRCWGGDILKANGTKSGLGDPQTRQMFDWLSKLVNTMGVAKRPADLPRLTNGQIDYNGFFGSGKVAMWQASPWHATALRTALGPKFGDTFGFTLMPKGPAGRRGQLVVEGYPIFRGTQNLEAAWEFTKFMTSREEGVARIDNGFVAAPRTDALSDKSILAKDPYYALYNQELIDNPPEPAAVPANNKITELYATMRLSFDGIWAGTRSVKDSLDAADSIVTGLLAGG